MSSFSTPFPLTISHSLSNNTFSLRLVVPGSLSFPTCLGLLLNIYLFYLKFSLSTYWILTHSEWTRLCLFFPQNPCLRFCVSTSLHCQISSRSNITANHFVSLQFIHILLWFLQYLLCVFWMPTMSQVLCSCWFMVSERDMITSLRNWQFSVLAFKLLKN